MSFLNSNKRRAHYTDPAACALRPELVAANAEIDTAPNPIARDDRAFPAFGSVAGTAGSLAQERSRTRVRLMARTQEGDRESCRTLLDDIGPMLMNFLRRRIANRQDLADVYQDTLMASYQARYTYQPSRPLEPWLYAIARNVASDHARRYWTRTKFVRLTDEIPEPTEDSDLRSEPSLENAIAQLPKQQREAFSMLKLEGLSIARGVPTRNATQSRPGGRTR